MTNDTTEHYFANKTVYFALKMMGPSPEKMLDSTYFNFVMAQSQYLKNTNSYGYNVTYKPIEYEYWGNKLPYVDNLANDKINLTTYIWPKSTNFFLRANYNSDNYEIIQIILSKWNGTNWKTDSEINQVLNTHYIDIEIVSAYFDFNDYENPIHTYIQDANIASLIPDYWNTFSYTVRINEVYANDGIWLGSQGINSLVLFTFIMVYIRLLDIIIFDIVKFISYSLFF